MKFIKNGIIYEPHNELVIEQMKKGGGYMPYEDTKEKEVEQPVEETKEIVEETPKKRKKK